MNKSSPRELWADSRWLTALLIVILISLSFGAGIMYVVDRLWLTPKSIVKTKKHEGDEDHNGEETEARIVSLPKGKWDVAGLRVEKVEFGNISGDAWLTGKLSLNNDRVAHIHSLVDGQVHRVNVNFGDDIKKGQSLAVIDSKEVGAAKLALYKDQLALEFARVNNEWEQKISANARELIEFLVTRPPLEKIDQEFTEKPMGEHRQQLVTAYARLHKSKKDVERLEPLANQGVAAGKQALAARAAYEGDRASFQALLEQLRFTTWQHALMTEQKMRQTEQAMAASRSRLFILGYGEADLENIDPLEEGESIAHYEIRAPFDGTVIGKNIVRAERVGPDTEMFQIADLSTLWVEVDIYQKDLPKLDRIGNIVNFRAPNSDHNHAATVFYTGDVLDPETRTVQLRAIVENVDRHLKAGMFIEVALPSKVIPNVLVVPASALQQIEGIDIVFVHTGEDQFEKRKVTLGARGDGKVAIRDGLKAGEPVVVTGGFALKSELMKGSISHGH